MKYYLILVLFYLFSISAYSIEDIEYTDTSVANMAVPINIASKIDKTLSAFLRDYYFKPIHSRLLPELFFANQVYLKKDKKIFFKVGVLPPEKLLNKIIPFENGFLFHMKRNYGFALYAQNVSKTEFSIFKAKFEQIVNHVRLKTQSSFIEHLSIFPKAYADEKVECLTYSSQNLIINTSDYDDVNNHFSSESMASIAGDCFLESVKQAWESTGGTISDAGQGLWNFIKSPIKSAKKAWSGAVNMVNTTMEFISNIKQNLSSLSGLFNQLSSGVIRSLLCMISGSIAGDQLLKILINPVAGLALLIPKITSMFKKIEQLSSILKTIDSAAKKIKNSGEFIGEAIKNLLKDKTGKLVKKVKELSNLGLEKLTLRLAACGL